MALVCIVLASGWGMRHIVVVMITTVMTMEGRKIMRFSNFHNDWFCGPEGMAPFFSHGGFLHLIFWGILLLVLYKIINPLFADRKSGYQATSQNKVALSILEKRYASGEIDQEEFLRKKKDLND